MEMDNNKGRRFWNWTVPKDGTDGAPNKDRVLFLSGAIAEESWFDDEVTPGVFREELMSGDGPVTVWINSPGGDCIAAAQIYNMLIDYPGDVTVKIDGLAASAASVIAMAGTKVLMSPVGMMMVLKTTEFNQNRPLILTKRNITDFNQNMAECSRNTIISLSSAI